MSPRHPVTLEQPCKCSLALDVSTAAHLERRRVQKGCAAATVRLQQPDSPPSCHMPGAPGASGSSVQFAAGNSETGDGQGDRAAMTMGKRILFATNP